MLSPELVIAIVRFHSRSCLPIFTRIRTLPAWNDIQQFEEGARPQIDLDIPNSKPPFAMVGADERCTLVLHASPPATPDFFSWEEVSELGLRIIQTCPVSGGSAYIGQSLRWGLMYVFPSF